MWKKKAGNGEFYFVPSQRFMDILRAEPLSASRLSMNRGIFPNQVAADVSRRTPTYLNTIGSALL